MLPCKQGVSECRTQNTLLLPLSRVWGDSTGGKRQLGASRMLGWLWSLWATDLWAAGSCPPGREMLSAQLCSLDESKWHPVLRMCIRKRMGSISSFREL